jgi:membrane protein implicated in regulation of membrane protease activity
MEGIFDHPALLFLIAGLLLLGFDIFVLGLSPLLFVAAGALATGGILYVASWKSGILSLAGWSPGFLEALALCAVLSLIFAIFGRGPLRKFQNANIQEDQSSDLIGREVITTHEVSKTEGFVYWSGTQWQARLAGSVEADHVGPGVRMRVVEVKNLALILRPADEECLKREPAHHEST